MNVACYQTAIGLSQKECGCFDAPAAYNTSDSGLFLDELEPLNALGGYDDCSGTSIWAMMDRAKTQGIHAFLSDTDALMKQHGKLKRETFKGIIGETYHRETVSTSATYAGMRIRCARVKSGVLRIKKIGTIFSATGTVAVTIYNNRNEVVAVPVTLDTTAGTKDETTLNTVIDLPLFDPYSATTDYFLVYSINQSNLPRRNRINCGCGGLKTPFSLLYNHYDDQNPRYTGGNSWANWMMVAGWEGDTITDFDEATTFNSNHNYGLFLNCEIYCNPSAVLCDGDGLDFDSDPLAKSAAWAIRYRAASIMAQQVLLSTALNRSQQVNREALGNARKEWDMRYNEMVQFIAQNANYNDSDCVACRPVAGMKVQSILT